MTMKSGTKEPNPMNEMQNPSANHQAVARKRSCLTRKLMIGSFRQELDEASRQLVSWQGRREGEASEVLEEVMVSLRLARAKQEQIRDAGVESWTTTLKQLSGVWRRLRAAMNHARAEFDGQAAEELDARNEGKFNTRPIILR